MVFNIDFNLDKCNIQENINNCFDFDIDGGLDGWMNGMEREGAAVLEIANKFYMMMES